VSYQLRSIDGGRFSFAALHRVDLPLKDEAASSNRFRDAETAIAVLFRVQNTGMRL
jgi:hypothetical protein